MVIFMYMHLKIPFTRLFSFQLPDYCFNLDSNIQHTPYMFSKNEAYIVIASCDGNDYIIRLNMSEVLSNMKYYIRKVNAY